MLYWVSPGCPFLCSLGWLDKTLHAKRAKAERGSRDEEVEIKQTGFFLLVGILFHINMLVGFSRSLFKPDQTEKIRSEANVNDQIRLICLRLCVLSWYKE